MLSGSTPVTWRTANANSRTYTGQLLRHFQRTAQRDHRGKHRMAVPTAFQMTDLWPRIGIKNEMFVQPLAAPPQLIVQQSPKINQIGAYPDEIIRHLIAPPTFMRRQTILRLIHAHHKGLRMRARNVQCGLTYATTSVPQSMAQIDAPPTPA